MNRRTELIRAEDQGWTELHVLVRRLSPAQLEEPGLTPDGWSVKDLLWHVGCWSSTCARALERMAMGTFVHEPIDVDALNREWLEQSGALDLRTVEAEWFSGRNRMLECFGALKDLTQQADDWFEESGPRHYAEHVAALREWVETLAPRG